MKKLWTIILAGLIMVSISTAVGAVGPQQKGRLKGSSDTLADTTDQISVDNLPDLAKNPKVKFQGIWGHEGSNETVGYVGGVLIKHGRVTVLKARWNTTDNTTAGLVVGILKKGYFNGKIILSKNETYRITGLYKLDRENKVLHLRWMTAQQVGWAHCRNIT